MNFFVVFPKPGIDAAERESIFSTSSSTSVPVQNITFSSVMLQEDTVTTSVLRSVVISRIVVLKASLLSAIFSGISCFLKKVSGVRCDSDRHNANACDRYKESNRRSGIFAWRFNAIRNFFSHASNPVEKHLIEGTRISQWRQSVFFISFFSSFFRHLITT